MKNSKNLRETMNQLEAPIDKEALWSKIHGDNRLIVKKKKPMWWSYLMSFGVLALLGSFFTMHFIGATQYEKQAKEISQTDQIQERNLSSYIEKAERGHAMSIANETVHEISKSEHDNIDANLQSKGIQQKQNEESKQAANTKRISKENQNDLNTLRSDSTNRTLSENQKKALLQKTTSTYETKQSGQLLDVYPNQTLDQITGISNDNLDQLFINKSLEQATLHSLLQLRTTTKELSYNRLLFAPSIESFIKPIYNRNRNWSFGFHFGIGHPIMDRTILLDSLMEESRLGEQFKEKTKTIESYSLGIELQRSLGQGYFIKIGGNLSYYYQRFESQNSYISYEKNEPSSDRFYTRKLTETNYSFYHQFRSLDFTASLGKEFRWKRLNFFLSGGVQYNLRFDVKGRYQGLDQALAELEELNIYWSRIPLAIQGELGIEFPINGFLSFYTAASASTAIRIVDGNPYYKQNLKNRVLNGGFKIRF